MALTAYPPSTALKCLVDRLGGVWHGNIAQCRCPAHKDNTPSLSIRQGDTALLVKCFGGCSSADVLRELRRISKLPMAKRAPLIPPVNSGTAHWRIWENAGPVEGTLAQRYLEQRRLELPIADIRFHPRCPLGPKGQTLFLPALIVAMRRAQRVDAIQRIFLDPQTATYTSKVVLGKAMGAAWTNNVTAEILAIGEGFESAAAYTALKKTVAWATMGAERLHQISPPKVTRQIILLGENNEASRKACARAAANYENQGRTVFVDTPPASFEDWADFLKAAKDAPP